MLSTELSQEPYSEISPAWGRLYVEAHYRTLYFDPGKE